MTVDGPARRELGPKASLAELVAGLVGVAPALSDAHRPNSRGDCAVCSLPQAGHVKYPCTLSVLAERARLIDAASASKR